MLVPSAVISFVLFASAGSTLTLNVNESVSGVDKSSEVHSEVPRLTGALLNETNAPAVMSNKSTNVLDPIPLSLKPPITRPSNACTQTNGVRSTCLQAGKRIKGDMLGVKKNIKKPGKANTDQLEAFSYKVKPGLVKKGFVISHIMVTNKIKVGAEGLVSIVKGGTLETEVELLMESQTGRRMDFQVEIYVSPVASAYKGQLGSLISHLKSM